MAQWPVVNAKANPRPSPAGPLPLCSTRARLEPSLPLFPLIVCLCLGHCPRDWFKIYQYMGSSSSSNAGPRPVHSMGYLSCHGLQSRSEAAASADSLDDSSVTQVSHLVWQWDRQCIRHWYPSKAWAGQCLARGVFKLERLDCPSEIHCHCSSAENHCILATGLRDCPGHLTRGDDQSHDHDSWLVTWMILAPDLCLA